MDCLHGGLNFILKLIHKGKVKDVYELDGSTYLFHFSDRISAFDVEIPTMIPMKGKVLCQFAKFWFEELDIENHMIGTRDQDKMIVKRLKMIPLEFIVRGYFYGSLVERFASAHDAYPSLRKFEPILASKLPEPLFDPTTKSSTHDISISEDQIVDRGILSWDKLSQIKETSINLYHQMSTIVGRAGFMIADTKFEFGHDDSGNLIFLADSLGPDEFRLWRKSEYIPGKVQKSYDKQILRDWLINTGFKVIVDEASRRGLKPVAPDLPSEIVNRLSHRYIYAYEQISNTSFEPVCEP
jgi:phosphoribosylaminoimidazole-succinocarboxamide synthase